MKTKYFLPRATVGVLAGSYLPVDSINPSYLTHRAIVRPEGGWPEPLCKRVRKGSLTDDRTQHTQARPTCPSCTIIFDREV